MAEFTDPKQELKQENAISSVDGRFRGNVEELSRFFSEEATIRERLFIEVEWLISLANIEALNISLTEEEISLLRNINKDFSSEDVDWVWNKDLEINHDTKAVELLLQEKLKNLEMEKLIPWTHFGLTSADVDCNSVVLNIKKYEKELGNKKRGEILDSLKSLISENKNSFFMGRSHGKPAVPTSMGIEFLKFYKRLEGIHTQSAEFKFEGKITGAIGNLNSLYLVYPEVDWLSHIEEFINNLGLENNKYTTQILPYDNLLRYFQNIELFNGVLKDFCEDIFLYTTMNYFIIEKKEGEVGSSTMPQKVNPIDFEMAKSYLPIANNEIDHMRKTLLENTLQRSLTDKYIARDLMGSSIAKTYLALNSILLGLPKLKFNKDFALEEMNQHFELLSEAIQMMLRKNGIPDAYEQIKTLTRGKTSMTKEEYIQIVDSLDINDDVKEELRVLTPEKYIGTSILLVEEFLK